MAESASRSTDRGGRAVFAIGLAAFGVSVIVGSVAAWSVTGGPPFGSMGYLQSIRDLRDAGHVDEAVRELRGDQRINLTDVRSSLMLARLLEELGRPGSVEALEFAARHSYDPYVQLRLAAALARTDRPDEADVALERALRIADDRADVQAAVGQAYEQTGRVGRARDAYRRALSLDPTNREAQQGLLRIGATGARS